MTASGPSPPLIDGGKGKLVEAPDRQAPTPAEQHVEDADAALSDGQKQPS